MVGISSGGAADISIRIVRHVRSEHSTPRRSTTTVHDFTDDEHRRILEVLPEDQKPLVQEIATRRRELKERMIPPEKQTKTSLQVSATVGR